MIDKRLMKEVLKQKHLLIIITLLLTFLSLITVTQAKAIAFIISNVFIGQGSLGQVWGWMIILLVVILVRGSLICLIEVCSGKMSNRIRMDLRNRLVSSVIEKGPVHIKNEKSGELANTLVEGLDSLDPYYREYLPQIISATLIPGIILIFVLPADVFSGSVMLFTAPLIPFFMILIGKWSKSLSQTQWEALSRMGGHFLDVLRGLTTLKLFGRSKSQSDVVYRISENFRKTTMEVLRIAFISSLVLELTATISTAIIAVTLGLRLLYGDIQFERAFYVLLLAPEFYLPLRSLGTKFHAGMGGITAAGVIYNILDGKVEGSSGGKAETDDLDTAFAAKTDITLNKVSFSYEHDSAPAIHNISFTLEKGKRTALVGHSGAGKSTLVSVLMRFLDNYEGFIYVNGRELKEIAIDKWRRMVSLIPQHPYLFYGTIEENISMGKTDATFEEVSAAAKAAGADEFILKMPMGYKSFVGEGGCRLSGGQLQRIAIARAFLKNAPVLILDEASSALDSQSEQRLMGALETLMAGRIVLIIAHRMDTVRDADKIIVLENGRLVEEGTHQELYNKMGKYHNLCCSNGGSA